MDVSAFQRILENMDDQDFKALITDVERARKRAKPSLREGAALWEQSKDEGMRIPGATRPASGDDLSRVARPQDQTPPASRVGGMNIPRGASPERLAQLLRAAEPGDWFRIDGDQAQNINLSQ